MSTEYGFFQLLDRFYNRFQGPTFPQEIPLVVSLCYYAFTMLLARILRIVNSRCIPQKYQLYTGDLITAFQICACALENSMMRRYYGSVGYCSTLFVLGMWYTLTIHGTRGNPCGNVIDYMKGSATFKKCLLRTAVQLIGGLLSYRYARSFWRLGLRFDDTQRFALLHCSGSLTVTPHIGLFIEFIGTFVECLLAVSTLTPFYASEVSTKVSISVFLTFVGVDHTGMYLNPVNASNQEFGCGNIPHLIHMMIYWVGPLLATALAFKLKQQADAFILSLRKGEEYSSDVYTNNYNDLQNGGHNTGNGYQSIGNTNTNSETTQTHLRHQANGEVPSKTLSSQHAGSTRQSNLW